MNKRQINATLYLESRISWKNVKHLLYVPNYTIDNHYLKYDSLFISYGEPIEPYEYSEGRHWYKGHGHVLYGSIIVDFVNAAGKHLKPLMIVMFNDIFKYS